MIRYNPNESDEVLPEGLYNATLERVNEREKDGYDGMYILEFKAEDGGSKVTEFVLMPNFRWKLHEFARLIGREDSYTAGTFDPHDAIGVEMVLAVMVDIGKDGVTRNKINWRESKAKVVAPVAPAPPRAPQPAARPAPVPVTQPSLTGDEDDVPF